jgi:integrase
MKKRPLIAGLPSGVGVSPNYNGNGQKFFRVRLGKRFTGGQIITKDFAKLESARVWIFGDAQKEKSTVEIIELRKRGGQDSFQVGAKDMAAAHDALKRCQLAGLSITEVVDFGLRHLSPEGGRKTVKEAVDLILERRRKNAGDDEGKSKHLKGLTSIANKFVERFGDELISTVSREMLEEWLDELDTLSTNTKASYARHIHILFNEAIDRKWTAENPTTKLSRNSESLADPEIFTPAQLKLLLHTAQTVNPDVIAGLTIKAFAGLRTSELRALDWSKVGSTEIGITARSAKTRKARPVTISPNLQAWLCEHRKDRGAVVGIGENAWYEALQRLSKLANIKLPSNVLRHSFGSYHLRKHRQEQTTAFEMGNTPGIVHKWYKNMNIELSDCDDYWSITPDSVQEWWRKQE